MNKIDKSIYNNLTLLPPDLQGWNGSSKVFHQLIDEVKPERIIEVGTWKGQSAINMADYCRQQNYKTEVWCVDTWLGALEFWDELKDTPERNLLQKNGYPQIYYQFLSNVVHHTLQDYIIPFPTTSLIGARYFSKHNVKSKLIYIDASHDYEDVMIDLEQYYPLLEDGGIIFGDDYEAWQDVKKAVNDFTTTIGSTFEVYENNFWTIRK